ncbi:hypothetical protein F4809DRAFT_623049 [Biscogniauxia mediterranea]|nr:hypothetical protein F4809DRAFT_623049 [Biscogniauxia mediterranea]
MAFQFIIHNVFLPPKLPQSADDSNSASHETELLEVVIKALGEFSLLVHPTHKDGIKSAQKAMKVFQKLRGGSEYIIEKELISALDRLAREDGGFPLHVSAQNAGMIITREQNHVRFESFELSPENKYAVGTKGRLRRCFPASVVSIPVAAYSDRELRMAIAHTIVKMSCQEVSEAKPKIEKEGEVQIEERDATDPFLVTDFLHTVLQTVGEAKVPSVIWKNTREEVLWNDAKLSWRRSPFWLLIRVALHIHLNTLKPDQSLYKEFMVFFMSSILKLAQEADVPTDFLYCMMAKVERRLIKLGKKNQYPWLLGVRQTLDSRWSYLEKCWQEISEDANTKFSCLNSLSNPISQEQMVDSYPDLDRFIEESGKRQKRGTGSAFRPPWHASAFGHTALPVLEGGIAENLEFNLLAYEKWVEHSLCNWIESHLRNQETCRYLAETMESYHQHAEPSYKGSPESLSIMLLTILELWVACDKSACASNHLLPDYSTEIPYQHLQSLVLYSRNHLERLSKVEDYLKNRDDNARSQYSALSSFGEEGSFSVRYFDTSDSLKSLKQRIETEAAQKREEKRAEFRDKRQTYRDLRSRADKPHDDYEFEDSLGVTRRRHYTWSCSKCCLDREADDLTIEIHEWPLPSHELKAQSTVFELEVPSWFNAWRDATMFVIHEVLKCQYSQREEGDLKQLSQYMPWYYSHVSRRLTVVSTTKPNRDTHRKYKNVGTASEDDILLRNGMTYRFYDSRKGCLVSSFTKTNNIPQDCMYKLSDQNQGLQDFIFRPAGKENGLSPNHVLSQQFRCSKKLSLEEFKAMATLPIGFRLQWSNILVQLFNPTVDFNKPDAALIILQIIHQAGLPYESAMYRASHRQLQDEEFVQKLIEGLSLQLDRIQQNWEAYVALKLFVCIAIRALNMMETSNYIFTRYSEFLKRCRSIATEWIGLLQTKVSKTDDDSQREEFFSIISQISLICISSFDIERDHLETLLSQEDQVSILIKCAMIVRSLLHNVEEPSDQISIGLTLQAKRVLHKAHNTLIREILESENQGLDKAINHRLSFFTRSSEWRSLSDMEYHWLETRDLRYSSTVHVNLLNGELLVNGAPPSRLPDEYESHPIFGTLFGRAMIEVAPSSIPGMSFSTTESCHGYDLLFGIDTSKPVDLLLVASNNSSQLRLELIPSRVFEEILPTSFVHDYVHWYCHDSQTDSHTIEFRPKNQPWVASPTNWVLRKDGSFWELERPGESLIRSKSPMANHLGRVLGTLEERHHMHMILCDTTREIKVDMPRLRLQFYLCPNSSKLQCRQYRGMYVDEHQGIGTLIGLRSKLTLRDDRNNRKILIPNGTVSYRRSSQHVDVCIEHDNSTRVHPYDVDTRLGRLVDNGSLASKLTLAYLHALTSFCLPNQLTSKTGTEDCLSILKSAAVRSFQSLSEEDLGILASISRLSPGREYYPENLEVMETIDWDDNLSFLSQDVNLNIEVQKIIKSASSTRFFYPDTPTAIPKPQHVDARLELRHQIRASTFHVSGFGAESHTTSFDAEYRGRDRVKREKRSLNAYAIASTVVNRTETLHASIPEDIYQQLWTLLRSSDGTMGPGNPLETEIGYDSEWLFEMKLFLPKIWCPFHRACGRGELQSRRFGLMFCLATMAYAEGCHFSAVQALAAFANIASIGQIEPPSISKFEMLEGPDIKEGELRAVVETHLTPFYASKEAQLTRRWDETNYEFEQRRSETFTNNQSHAISTLLNYLRDQWPCKVLRAPNGTQSFDEYLYTGEIMEKILPNWQIWFNNLQLSEYLKKVTYHLKESVRVKEVFIPTSLASSPSAPLPHTKKPFIDDEDLFAHPKRLIHNPSRYEHESFRSDLGLLDKTTHQQENTGALGALVDFLGQRTSQKFERRYLEGLRASQKCLEDSQGISKLKKTGTELREELQSHLLQCEEKCKETYGLLRRAVGFGENRCSGESSASVYVAPRISPSFFLGQLARARWERLHPDWKKAIVAYASSLAMAQRAERMFFQDQDEAGLVKELENPGHTNWDPMEYPESLLLEVESGIMIRHVQEVIAERMRTPPDSKNAVMQLNMGEGKSSVIVPIVAAHLADGKKLVRVIVAKPQAKELLRTLISKLGGLMDHQIYHMPFSRSLKLEPSDANTVLDLCKQCTQRGGILLVQPEHLLSFQLMGIESQLNAREHIGQIILNTHQYFNKSARDLVDESDENFHVKFELIYTMGEQTPIELSPERWVLIQRILRIVMSVIGKVQQAFPGSVDITPCDEGQFPRTRLLRKDAEERLLVMIADKISETGLRGFPIHLQSERVRESVRKYILHKDLTILDIEEVEDRSGFFTESIQGLLLLLRGLLAEGILGFALREKRWRVNYGLDLDRIPETRLAVPYRAKDNPTARSEFSHPDAVIILTCLSYYYGGLSNENLFTAFDHLLMTDQAEVEYRDWVQDAPGLDPSFRTLAGVTMKDHQQLTGVIFPHLRWSKNAIDYFLSHSVFPREMKEFPQKLSASGWDIGRTKAQPTTGFSGTCDSQELLPLDMKHLDLESQRHTNALVAEYLLRPENNVIMMPKSDCAKRSNADELLNLVISMDSPVQVILDVGAQILEMTNSQLAEAWLHRVPENHKKEAVIFFDENDDLCVLDRQGCIEKLQTSPYCHQLDLCLVFLDEAHTRGTDLKLPKYHRAAVTLGAGLTKDRLVQACMRMRKLGQGQSVVFCVSEEIGAKITSLKRISNDDPKPTLLEHTADNHEIKVLDVLAWTIWETFADLRRSIPIWALQGQRFENQKEIWESVTEHDEIRMSREKAASFLENEAQSLEYRYRPKRQESQEQSIHAVLPNPDGNPQLEAIQQRCQEFGVSQFGSSLLSEEQERELSPEVVQERQIERPPEVDPAEHAVHPDVLRLVQRGTLERSPAFLPAFEALANTTAARELDLSSFPDDVLVTDDFARTVRLVGRGAQADCYQRPVQWILRAASSSSTCDAARHLVIVSPHEAQELMPEIEASAHVHLHAYAPLPSLDCRPLDRLRLRVVPRPRTTDGWRPSARQRLLLNLFAGQLHFSAYADYVATCGVLGLSTAPTADGFRVEPDGFVVSGPGWEAPRFGRSPVRFLRIFLMAIRQQGDGSDKTHWGKILGGERLEREADFSDIV